VFSGVYKIRTYCLSEGVMLILSAIISLTILSLVLWYGRYGIDISDDSYYLVFISNPFNNSASVTQFGFIYHPLYELLDGNIAALRRANVLVTFGLAWVLAEVFLRTVFGNQTLNRLPRLVVSAAIATAVLIVFATWPMTPSYNTLALQGLLVAAIGLMLCENSTSHTSLIGWVLIGIGGWLAFMAKPTTAAALGVCSVGYLLWAGKIRVRLLAVSVVVATGATVIFAFAIHGSVIAFVDQIADGAEMARIVLGKETAAQYLIQPLRVDFFSPDAQAVYVLIAGTVVVYTTAYCIWLDRNALATGGRMLLFAISAASLAIGLGYWVVNVSRYHGLLLWSVVIAAMLFGYSSSGLKGLSQISRRHWAIALSFLIFPHIYAFGTHSNYWKAGAPVGVFWVLFGLVYLTPMARNQKFFVLILSFVLAVQLITVALVQSGFSNSYRQSQPLNLNDYKIDIGRSGSALILSQDYGRYFADALSLADQAHFKKGTPMIDLSGQSPGVLYALGAKSIGRAWIIGGYIGSDDQAVAALNRVSCEEISVAWLLAEPNGPRAISPEILGSFGADISRDYEIVGTLRTAEGAGGYKERRVQQFLQPVRSFGDALNACNASRKSRS
jgi:hypothetical protein